MPKRIIKIGVDVDDILFNTCQGFIDFFNKKYNCDLKREDFYTFDLSLSLKKVPTLDYKKDLEEMYASKDFNNLLPIEKSVEYLSHLKKYNFEFYAITARSEIYKDQTFDWINKHFPDIFTNIFVIGGKDVHNTHKSDKGIFSKELGIEIFIDDALHNAENLSKNDIHTILLNQPWNQEEIKSNKIYRVYDWKEIVDKVLELADKIQ